MIHIVCQDWISTSGNHAGMVHLYKLICSRKNDTKLYVLNKNGINPKGLNTVLTFLFGLKLCFKIKKGDKVLLTEYMIKYAHQNIIASLLKFFHPSIHICAMVHLIPEILEHEYDKDKIIKYSSKINFLITLGSSLTSYLNSLGINNVYTLFHYVDGKYYFPSISKLESVNNPLRVIVMGALGRNYNMLIEIVSMTPEVHFVICKGKNNIGYMFEKYENVTLLSYMPEEELKHEMDIADISLNVMDDTIGSNVICTSLAMGLAMVVSDVGSIRDYCSESNTLFCSDSKSFSLALKQLAQNPRKVIMMKKASIEEATKISVENYMNALFNIINKIR